MIPKKLILKGVYSYQEEQTIDFEYLTKAQLFGVFGSVGSGKSTLLEAISFALYGQTERLGKNDDLKYNMMNLKSSALFIELEFENYDGKRYRFTVSGKRNSKNFSDVRTFTRSAYLKQDNEWIPLPNSSAEPILGLSYNNFRRTIIIPQGKFQEFLQLGNTERTRMLKDIFNLSKYEYEFQTKALRTKNNQEKEYLLGKLTNYETVSKDILNIKKKELTALEQLFDTSKKELEALTNQEKEQAKVKELFGSLKLKNQELLKHQEQEQTILAQEKSLVSYEEVNAKFKDKLKRSQELETEKSSLEKELKTSQETRKQLEQQKLELETESKKIEKDLALIPKQELELKDLDLILKIKTKESEKEEKALRIKKGSKKVEETTITLKTEQATLTQLKTTKTELSKKQLKGSFETFSELKNWFTKFSILKKEENKKKNEVKELTSFTIDKKQTFLSSLSISGIEINAKTLQELVQSKEKERTVLETSLANQREKINEYKVRKELDKLAHAVKDGEPCPLCGALEHPEVLNVDSIDNDLKIEVEKLSVIEESIKNKSKELETIRFFENDLKINLTQIAKVEESLKEIELGLKTEQEAFKWKEYSIDEETKVNQDFERFKIQENEIKELISKIEKANERITLATTNKEKYSKAIVEIELAYHSIKTEIETYTKQLSRLKAIDFDNTDTIAKEVISRSQFIKETNSKSEQLAKQTIAVNQQLAVEKERLQSTTKRLAISIELLKKASELINTLLSESKFDSIADVKQILELNLNIEGLKKEITAYKIKLETLKSVIKEKELALKDKSFDLEKYSKLIEQLTSKTTAFKSLEKQKITAEASSLKLEKDLLEKGVLEKDLAKKELRADNIATLITLFKQSGFVNYISSVYLENLCNEANVRFSQLTRQQLKLEIGSKNEFLIRDYLNEGKVRSVKTLSGGQMFQASLSLALALAESIQQQNKANQNFFFLDEGFGSQDKESLQIVFESLKALRKENRVVGVISHVEELQQEISTYLHIINHKDVGSKIDRSWGN